MKPPAWSWRAKASKYRTGSRQGDSKRVSRLGALLWPRQQPEERRGEGWKVLTVISWRMRVDGASKLRSCCKLRAFETIFHRSDVHPTQSPCSFPKPNPDRNFTVSRQCDLSPCSQGCEDQAKNWEQQSVRAMEMKELNFNRLSFLPGTLLARLSCGLKLDQKLSCL